MSRAGTTARIAILVFGFQVVAAAALLAGVGAFVRWQLTAQATAAADLLREDLLSVYARDGLPALIRTIEERAGRRATPGAVMLLADRDYAPLAGMLAQWPRGIDPDDRTVDARLFRAGHAEPEEMRVRVTPLPEGAHLLTGMVVQGEARALAVLGEASLVALALATVLALVTAGASARMFAARLAAPVAALEAARRGDLAQRVGDTSGGDAFAALARVVNATLDRLADLVAELRLATDAMAHDLKSPITRLRAALDRIDAAAGDPAALRAAVARAQDEAVRLLGIVEAALSIARAEAGIGREAFVPVDLAAMLEDMAEIYGPVAEDAARAIAVEAAGGIVLAVHRELLGQAIGNLIDNSLKYGAGAITLGLAREDGRIALRVADAGPGIAPADRDAALRKFGRLDAARTSAGAGLGLSLVAAVARLHDGELELRDAAPGLAVVMLLPV